MMCTSTVPQRTCFMPALRQPLHLLLSWSELRSSLLKSLIGFSCWHCWHFLVRSSACGSTPCVA